MANAAGQIWPHLKTGIPEPAQQRRKPNSLGEALWPQLSAEAKAQDAARARNKEILLRNLRELNARMRER
jgi:hypothetical protein